MKGRRGTRWVERRPTGGSARLDNDGGRRRPVLQTRVQHGAGSLGQPVEEGSHLEWVGGWVGD